MKALIIIACVVGYLIMWVVAGVLVYRTKEGSLVDAAGIGFFWPVALPFAIVMVLVHRISKRLDKKKEEELK